MNFKRVAALLLAGAMVMTAVPVYAKGDDVTLSVSIWDTNQEPGIKEILADFTEKTGIKTEISVVKWDEYWTMLEAGAQGGSLPDVFWMHSNESQRYMSNDMLLDLTDKIKDSDLIDPENYPEDIWGLYTYDDKYYAVPKDIDTIALWYNKTLFDEAGLDYPTADWTWDDVTEAAKKLTKDDGSQYGLGMRNDNNQAGYYNLIYDNGDIVSPSSVNQVIIFQLLETATEDSILSVVGCFKSFCPIVSVRLMFDNLKQEVFCFFCNKFHVCSPFYTIYCQTKLLDFYFTSFI